MVSRLPRLLANSGVRLQMAAACMVACCKDFGWECALQVEGMERALDEDTQAALDGIVGQYRFSARDLRTFEELVGAFWSSGRGCI